ncbi:MAG: NYN domain-containing protein [Gemmatimonadales bacterium]
MRTIVYVDAFNLDYGSLRGSPYRWLDLEQLARRLLASHNQLVGIKYFTARVAARPGDPDQPNRQPLYLRALGTLTLVEVHFGHYLTHVVKLPLASPPPGGARYAEVIKTEEKGSDVNLATHLIADGYEGRYDCAALITNDSDLLEPVRLVRGRLQKPVGVLNPQRHPSFVLSKAASFFKQIRPGALKASQFADSLRDSVGPFRKPPGW